MAGIDFSVKYTDDKYVTKTDLPRALGTTLIEPFWVRIEDYRKANAKRLSLRSFTQVPFSLTLTTTIASKLSLFTDKLASFTSVYSTLNESPRVKEKLAQSAKFKILKALSKIEGVDAYDLSLKAMLNGTYMENNPEHQILLGYRNALSDLEKDYQSPITEDLLFEIYETILCTTELTSLYRESDPKNVYSAIQVARDDRWAPAREIQEHMDRLFSFLTNDTSDAFTKATMAFYFLVYVRPFDAHNEAIASLMAKYVLAQGGYGEAAALLPLEEVLQPKDIKFDTLFLETQRQADLTYIALYLVEKMSPEIDLLKNELAQIQASIFKEEAPRVEKEDVSPVMEAPKEVAPEVVVPSFKEVPVAPKEAPVPVAKQIEPAPTPAVQESAIPRLDALPSGGTAITLPAPKMSDKEIREYARYIVETNPNIRKPQAAFFAAHSTIGRYYTIQDYKKATRCAYETARTSMDNLAAHGFYKKLQIKNKFVYTPIKQGE